APPTCQAARVDAPRCRPQARRHGKGDRRAAASRGAGRGARPAAGGVRGGEGGPPKDGIERGLDKGPTGEGTSASGRPASRGDKQPGRQASWERSESS